MSRAIEVRTRPQGPCIESEWIERIAAGDAGAFERLWERYAPRVFRFATRRLSNRADAEETS